MQPAVVSNGADKAPAPAEMFRGMNALQIAEHFVRSGFFKDANDVSKAVVKIMAGAELGIAPMAAMMGIHIVQGKPQLSGNLIAAQIKRHPRYDYRVLEHNKTVCRIEFQQDGQPAGVSEFTIQQAQTAGLLKNPTWQAYPENMLFNRAMSNGAKWYCPDVFNGVPVYYEGEIEEAVAARQQEPVQEAQLVESKPAKRLATPEQLERIEQLAAEYWFNPEQLQATIASIQAGNYGGLGNKLDPFARAEKLIEALPKGVPILRIEDAPDQVYQDMHTIDRVDAFEARRQIWNNQISKLPEDVKAQCESVLDNLWQVLTNPEPQPE